MAGEGTRTPTDHEIAAPSARMFASDGASRALGIELLRAAEGTAEVRMRITSAMVNGHAIVHGGYIFLLADTAFACACNSYGPVTVAAGADITFVASAYEGDVLLAEVSERARYGRSGIYDVTVRRETGELIAEFRGRSREIRPSGTGAPSPSGDQRGGRQGGGGRRTGGAPTDDNAADRHAGPAQAGSSIAGRSEKARSEA